MVLDTQVVRPHEESAKPPSVRSRGVGLLLLLFAVGWILLAGAQAFVGSPHGAGWASVRSQLHWIPTILSNAPRNFGTFLLVSIMVLAMALPGAAILRLFRVHWHDWFEHGTFAVAAGLAGWVPLVLVVGTYVGLSRLDVAVTTGLYIVIPSLWIVPAFTRNLASSPPGLLQRTCSYARDNIKWFDVILIVLIMVLLYMALLGALIPEIQFDARWYHLGSAAHYVEVGHFYNIVAATHDPAMGLNPYQEIAYTGFYALTGSHGAKALAFLDAPLICTAIVAFARVHFASIRLGLLAALAFLSLPIASWSAATASNDLPVALYTLLAVHALLLWLRSPRTQWGYAYLGIAMAAFRVWSQAVRTLDARTLRGAGHPDHPGGADLRTWASAKRLAIMGGVVIVVCGSWWIRVGAMTGNPVFPFAYGIFPSRYWNGYAAAAQNHMNRPVHLSTLPVGAVESLWNTVTNPVPYQVIVGPLFLVGIPLVLLLACCTTSRPRPAFVLLGLFMLGWWIGWYIGGFSTSRYLVAIAPLACLWMAIGIADAFSSPRFGRALPMVTMVALVLICLSTTQFFTTLERGSVTPGVEGSIPYDWAYLYQGQPEFDVQLISLPMVDYINSHLNARTTKVYDAASLYDVYEYLRPEMFDGSTYGSPTTMRQWTLYGADAVAQLHANHVTDLVMPATAVGTLLHTDLWPHLSVIHRSPDGLVLFSVRY